MGSEAMAWIVFIFRPRCRAHLDGILGLVVWVNGALDE